MALGGRDYVPPAMPCFCGTKNVFAEPHGEEHCILPGRVRPVSGKGWVSKGLGAIGHIIKWYTQLCAQICCKVAKSKYLYLFRLLVSTLLSLVWHDNYLLGIISVLDRPEGRGQEKGQRGGCTSSGDRRGTTSPTWISFNWLWQQSPCLPRRLEEGNGYSGGKGSSRGTSALLIIPIHIHALALFKM